MSSTRTWDNIDSNERRFRSLAADFMATYSTSQDVRNCIASELGYDEHVWRRMADVGFQGILVPAQYGGLGFGLGNAIAVLEETGRRLICGPFFSTSVLSVLMLREAAAAEPRHRYLREIAEGRLKSAVAISEDGWDWDPGALKTYAERSGDTYQLTGTKRSVLGTEGADVVLVVARCDDGLGLFAVDEPGQARIRPLETLDVTRRQACLELEATPASRLSGGEDALQGVRRALDKCCITLAAEGLGGAEACLDMSVEHARRRYQFGQPIGAFQAIKHKCADMLVRLEASRSAVYRAAEAADTDDSGLPRWASLCQVYCAESYVYIAGECLQIHGGMGYTWDHDAHLYLRRSKASSALLGSPSFHRRRLSALLGLSGEPIAPRSDAQAGKQKG